MNRLSIAVENLTCSRGEYIIASNITFELSSGQALLLRGPNGSGKTTLLRTLAGFLEPHTGTIEIHSKTDEMSSRLDRRDSVHYVGHANAVKSRLPVIENVMFWQKFYTNFQDINRAELALDLFGLMHLADYRAAHLSQGQSRRLGLTRLLSTMRPIWLLDEPSVSLDRSAVAMLERAIASHLHDGGIAIISTHLDLNLPYQSTLHLQSGSEQNIE